MLRRLVRVVLGAAICGLPGLVWSQAALPPAGEMTRCLDLIRAKQYQAARDRLEPIVLGHPGWARAHFLLGLTYHEEQRYERARPLFARALALDAQERAVLPYYGWCLYYLGEPEDARRQFVEYLETNPGYADAHFALALLDFDRDDLNAAAERFDTAIRLAAAAGDARIEGKARARLADVHVRRGALPAARAELERAVVLRPDAYEAYFKLSRVLERLGDREGAALALRRHDEVREQVRPGARPPSPPAVELPAP
jgi:tetratricopeptide (TPR) repeat protein